MERNKKVMATLVRYLLFTGVLLLAGCGGQEAAGGAVRQINDTPIDSSAAVEITLPSEAGAQDVLLRECFSGTKGGSDGSTFYEVDVCRQTEEGCFYTVSHGEDMAQYTFLNQVFRVNPETKTEEMLYETREAFWLNEFEAAGGFLYWVEYLGTESKGEISGTLYRIMQYELATGEVSCIAERNGEEVFEICLAAADDYVTWYDDFGDGKTEVVIYDVKTEEVHTLSGAKKFSAYARLDIVDGGITYFSEDEEGNIFVNRYVLDSGKTEALMLGKRNAAEKLSGCFSTEKYMGWRTDGSTGWRSYYFYDRESALYSLRGSKEINVFSAWLSDKLYLNCHDSEGYTLYVCDLSEGRTWQEKLEGHGMQFREYGDGQVYLEVRTEDEVKLMEIDVPGR